MAPRRFTISAQEPALNKDGTFTRFWYNAWDKIAQWSGEVFVRSVSGAAPISSTGGENPIISLNDSGVTPGTYGDATNTPTPTVTVKGLISSLTTVATKVQVSASARLLGRGSASGAGPCEEITLDTTLTLTGTQLGVTGGIPGFGGRLLNIQMITATGGGTYTATSGTNFVIIELLGAGGGAGGISSPGGANIAFGRSAGAGGYIRTKLSANFSGASYSVGAKGTGGTAGANDGTDGADTTFTDTAGSPTTYTAGGGKKGVGGSGGAAGGISTVGGAGGACTNGDLRVPGEDAGYGFSTVSPNVVSGNGGSAFYGSGGRGKSGGGTNTSQAGNNATGFGAGGSGAAGAGTGVARAGGDGSNGLLVIWEYS